MSETKRGAVRLSGHFLALDVYERPDGSCRGDVVYVESPTTRTTIMTVEHPSLDALIDANVKDSTKLISLARELCPAIGRRESAALTLMGHLPFKPSDVNCEECAARPGEGCDGPRPHEDRVRTLQHFLIWLAERPVPALMTRQLISDVVERMGHDVNPYDDHPVIVERASTGECAHLYVAGRRDATKYAWLSSGSDLSDPTRGPFRNEIEIALAASAWSRGE